MYMKNKPHNQPNILSILKSLGLLLLIVIVCSLLSRYLYGSGQTLRQYADSQPQEANTQPQEENPLSQNDNSQAQDDNFQTQDIEEVGPNAPEISEENTANNGENQSESVFENPLRTVYQDGFYYEPLSDELKDYITGISYPADGVAEISYEDLNYVHVLHYDFDGEIAQGELICNQAIAQDMVEIFYELYLTEYRIERITLIDAYDGDDNASMIDNNTSCFNYRTVAGQSHLSKHAFGLAIDINPFYNPYIQYLKEGGRIVLPEGSEAYTDRSADFPYKIDTEDFCYKLFIEHGFTWGGNWNTMKDYQHFQKAIE